jgi:hypothetical protein
METFEVYLVVGGFSSFAKVSLRDIIRTSDLLWFPDLAAPTSGNRRVKRDVEFFSRHIARCSL